MLRRRSNPLFLILRWTCCFISPLQKDDEQTIFSTSSSRYPPLNPFSTEQLSSLLPFPRCISWTAPSLTPFLSPVYELANYITLGRVLYYIPYHSPLHPGRVITTFGGVSAIVEILTAQGAFRSANKKNSQSEKDAGKAMLKAALVIQLGVIIAFVTLAVRFQLTCKKNGVLVQKVKTVLYTLYASMGLILIRTIFRTVEYFSIADFDFSSSDTNTQTLSPIIRYEWFFYVFELVPMLINTFLLNARHPAMFLPKKNTVYLAKDGVTEIEGPGYKDRRGFVVTLLDPFDLVGL
ncbi:MAG: hypothetical protein Q9217_006748, partial [Psora testacea]